MGIAVGILIFLVLGVIISRLAKLLGSKIFKFSSIYNFILKLFKKIRYK